MCWVSTLLQIRSKPNGEASPSIPSYSLSLSISRSTSFRARADRRDGKPMESEGMCAPALVRSQLLPLGGKSPLTSLGQACSGRTALVLQSLVLKV